jgi:hypothetical protein
MNKLVYIYVPNKCVICYVFVKLLIKMIAVDMVNKTYRDSHTINKPFGDPEGWTSNSFTTDSIMK